MDDFTRWFLIPLIAADAVFFCYCWITETT